MIDRLTTNQIVVLLPVRFWCHIMIDRLTTNQIVVLLPVRGRTEFGKRKNNVWDWLQAIPFLPAPSPSRSPPLNFSSILCSPQACSFARPLFRSLVRSPPGKGKETAATKAMTNPPFWTLISEWPFCFMYFISPCSITSSFSKPSFKAAVKGTFYNSNLWSFSWRCGWFQAWNTFTVRSCDSSCSVLETINGINLRFCLFFPPESILSHVNWRFLFIALPLSLISSRLGGRGFMGDTESNI